MKPSAARLVRTAALASLLTAMTAIGPAVAHADPTPPCYGASCNGLDPQAEGCAGSNAYTVASFTIDNGLDVVSLRYSDWCHANWTTVYVNSYSFDTGEFWVQNKNGDAQYYGFSYPATWWTNMVNGVPLARACVQDNDTYPNGHCTLWH